MTRPRTAPTMAIVLGATAVFAATFAYPADRYERKVPYAGSKVTSLTLMCKASHLAAGGFWRNPGDTTVYEGARIEQEPQPTFWRISISGIADDKGTAEVIRFNANHEALEAPLSFSAELTFGGLLLVRAKRPPGTSPEIISIDPANSSFVYSSQHVNVMYNRANIWYGSCKPYQ